MTKVFWPGEGFEPPTPDATNIQKLETSRLRPLGHPDFVEKLASKRPSRLKQISNSVSKQTDIG